MRPKTLLVAMAVLIALLVSTFAFQLTSSAFARQYLVRHSMARHELACQKIADTRSASILLGTKQDLGRTSITNFKQIMVKARSRNDSPTGVRMDLQFNDKKSTQDRLFVFPGGTTFKTFDTNGASSVSVQAYAYMAGTRPAYDNIFVDITGCK